MPSYRWLVVSVCAPPYRWLVVSVCLCAAQNIAMFIVFHFFAGAGSWGFLALCTTPLFLTVGPLTCSALPPTPVCIIVEKWLSKSLRRSSTHVLL